MTIRTLLIFTLIFFTNSANTFSQQQGKTAAEFEIQGAAAQRSGNCNEAVKHYAEAIKINPKSFIGQANSGTCYLQLEKPQQALGHLQVAVTLKPTDPLVHYLLGLAYQGTNQTLHAYTEALKLNSESELTYYNLGVGLREVGKHNEAAAAFKRATEIKKDFREAIFNLAIEYEDLGEQTKFLEMIKEALKLDPNNLVVVGKYGIALRNNCKQDCVYLVETNLLATTDVVTPVAASPAGNMIKRTRNIKNKKLKEDKGASADMSNGGDTFNKTPTSSTSPMLKPIIAARIFPAPRSVTIKPTRAPAEPVIIIETNIRARRIALVSIIKTLPRSTRQ